MEIFIQNLFNKTNNIDEIIQKVKENNPDEYETLDDAKNVYRNGDYGDAVSTDEYGVLAAIFKLPAETFLVGDRQMVIADVATIAGLDNSTSKGSVNYNA